MAARTRLEANSAWDLVEFILASLVFLLVGLQLRGIIDRLPQYELSHLLTLGAAISATLIISRFVWVFLTFYPATALVAVFRGGKFTPGLSHPTIISWAGIRRIARLNAVRSVIACIVRF